MINKDRLIDTFIEYVKIDSETLNEAKMVEKLVEEMKALGMEVWTDNAGEKIGSNGNNVYGYLKGDLDLEPLLFSAHMDTVTPGNNVKPVIKDGAIYSSGDTILGGDDKSGIVAVIESIRRIKEEKLSHGPIEVLFTICEEGGLKGSKNADYTALKSQKAFVLDSGDNAGKVVIKAPAQDKIVAKIKGKSAHAGVAPETGISAIQVAAEAIVNMKLLRIDEETTANIGMINGGVATNIVCPEVQIVAEARSLDNDKLKAQTAGMVEALNNAIEKFGATMELEVTHSYDAMNIKEEDEILSLAKGACERASLNFSTGSTGGGSDSNIFNSNGIKAVTLGTGMSKVHTVDEFITIDNLVNTAKLVLQIMLRK